MKICRKFDRYLFIMFFMLYSGFVVASPATSYIDKGVNAGDDFYLHANGLWIKKMKLRLPVCSSQEVRSTQIKMENECLRGGMAGNVVSELYRSLINKGIDTSEVAIKKEFDYIDTISSVKEIPKLLAHLSKLGVGTNFLNINTTQENGIWYPNISWGREINATDYKLMEMVSLDIYGFEKIEYDVAHAKAEINKYTQLKSHNFTIGGMKKAMNDVFWDDYFTTSGLANYMSSLKSNGQSASIYIVSGGYALDFFDPFKKLNTIFAKYPIPMWNAYFKYLVLLKYKNREGFHDASEAVLLVREVFGFDLGSVCFHDYIKSHEPKVMDIFENVKSAFGTAIASTSWMSQKTKDNAYKKLGSLQIVIGYAPDHMVDYSRVTIDNNNRVGNLMRIAEAQYQYRFNMLYGTKVESRDWENTIGMSYHLRSHTLRVHLASILPPYFYESDNFAINYGTIGAIIGHEMSHAFEMDDWIADNESDNFDDTADLLIKQYKSFFPNSAAQTVMEDMADNFGLMMSFKALSEVIKKRSLNEEKGDPEIKGGITNEQLFYYGWAHLWRWRGGICTVSTHSLDEVRTNGPLRNQPGFYKAFKVESGDRMYLPPEQRIDFSQIP